MVALRSLTSTDPLSLGNTKAEGLLDHTLKVAICALR
jgi:hypothetical protein